MNFCYNLDRAIKPVFFNSTKQNVCFTLPSLNVRFNNAVRGRLTSTKGILHAFSSSSALRLSPLRRSKSKICLWFRQEHGSGAADASQSEGHQSKLTARMASQTQTQKKTQVQLGLRKSDGIITSLFVSPSYHVFYCSVSELQEETWPSRQ